MVTEKEYKSLLDNYLKLLAQLPDEMKHCTIQFKECEKGHGRLTATNWVQHECQQCEIERLTALIRHNALWLLDSAALAGDSKKGDG